MIVLFCFSFKIDSKVDAEKHLSSFCYRDNNMYANVNTDLNRSFNGKDSNSNRKRAFCSAPKPDTPPVSLFVWFLFGFSFLNPNHHLKI